MPEIRMLPALPREETPLDRTTRAYRARRSHQGYAVDPLQCPQCGHTLRRLGVSDEPAVLRRLLNPRRRWDPQPKAPDPPVATRLGPPNPRSPSLALPFPTAPAPWADHPARVLRAAPAVHHQNIRRGIRHPRPGRRITPPAPAAHRPETRPSLKISLRRATIQSQGGSIFLTFWKKVTKG